MVLEDRDNPQGEKSKSTEGGERQLSLLSLALEHDTLSKNVDLLSSSHNGLLKSVKNVAAVYGQMIPELPGAIANQLKHDLVDETGSTMTRFAESAAIGLGTAVLLARSPVLAKTLLTGAGIGSSALMIGSASSFSYEALGANSILEQKQLAESGTKSISRLSAGLIETAPALAAGTTLGLKLSSRVAALDSIAIATRNSAEFRTRMLVPEGFHYFSLDAQKIAAVAEGSEMDLMRAGKEMMRSTPWRGVEEGRFFKISENNSVKVSARIPGSQYEVLMGPRAQQMFHTHDAQIIPSSGDFTSVYGTGIVGLPKEGILTFYEGAGREAENIVALTRAGKMEKAVEAATALHERSFPSLIVDESKQLSMRVDLRWNPQLNRLEPTSIRPLDYADTVKNLSKWDGRLNISAIQTAPEALLKPGMTELMRKLNPRGI